MNRDERDEIILERLEYIRVNKERLGKEWEKEYRKKILELYK